MKIVMSCAGVARCLVLFAALMAVPACSGGSSSAGSTGDTGGPPGAACTDATECGCWTCVCSGGTTAARACIVGQCDTGDDVCQTGCDTANMGSVVSSTPGGDCN